MAEVLEYSIAVLVSSLFVAGSVATYGAFSAFESSMQLRATFTSVTNLVYSA
jgi:ABC-type transporter Mla subunit MlaD